MTLQRFVPWLSFLPVWGVFMGVWMLSTATPVSSQVQTAAGVGASLPAEQFFQRPSVLKFRLSPSGKRLAVTTARGGHRVGLLVIELQEPVSSRRVALFPDAEIRSFEWVGDDRLVFDTTDLDEGSGRDLSVAPGLYSINVDGSGFKILARRSGPGAFRELRDVLPHQLLMVPLPQEGVPPGEVLIGVPTFKDGATSTVRPQWLDVRSGQVREADLRGAPPDVVDWKFDSKGQPRVAITIEGTKRFMHWRGPSDAAWRKFAMGDVFDPIFMPQAVDDSGILYVTHPEGPEGLDVLARFDPDKGAPSTPPLVRTPGFDFEGGLLLDNPGNRAMGVRLIADAEQTIWYHPAMQQLQAQVDERFPGRVNRLSCSRCGQDDRAVMLYSYADQDPGSLWVYESGPKRWRFISSMLDGIDPGKMAQVALQRIKARDGRDLPVWLTLPSGVPEGQALPVVVLVHGGPWLRGGWWQWEPLEQFLASRGYLVISPGFRGSTGYGDAHFRAGSKQWGLAMQDDVADALLWARAQGLASDRACIAGGGYGGYSALMGLIRHPELYRCGVAWNALTDLPFYVKGSVRYGDNLSDLGRSHFLPKVVGDAEKDAKQLMATSPLMQAARIKVPLLLAYGDSDISVPLVHGSRLREALKSAGQAPEWVDYSGEGHQWRLMSTQLDFARRLEAFFAKHLKGPKGP